MSVSVIVPVYNNIKTLEACVDSILKQTYEDIELILVSNGCIDGSDKLCDTLSASDRRIRHIPCPVSGVSSARNLGLEAASGEYIGFVDADDYIDPGMYSAMVSAVQKNGSDICLCGYFTHTGDIVEQKCPQKARTITGPEFLSSLFTDENTEGFVWNRLFKKETISGLLFNPELSACEDLVFNAMTVKRFEGSGRKLTVSYIPEAFYHYVRHAGSATSGRRLFREGNFIYSSAFAFLYENFSEEDILPLICRKYHDILRYSRFALIRELKSSNDPAVKDQYLNYLSQLKTVYRDARPFIKKAGLSVKQRLSFMLLTLLPVRISAGLGALRQTAG